MFVGGDSLDEDKNPSRLDNATMIQSDSAKYCYKNISNIGIDHLTIVTGNAGKIIFSIHYTVDGAGLKQGNKM
jgi:hypothetical protein